MPTTGRRKLIGWLLVVVGLVAFMLWRIAQAGMT